MHSLMSFLALLAVALTAAAALAKTPCPPTTEDEMGPFYRPGAPLRSVIGEGYLLTGTVRSAGSCEPLGHALIEFWMAGTDGYYSDAMRAAVITGPDGRYRLESGFPGFYATRPPHIHIRVSAPGHLSVVTQHYPEQGAREAGFDLVLPKEEAP